MEFAFDWFIYFVTLCLWAGIGLGLVVAVTR